MCLGGDPARKRCLAQSLRASQADTFLSESHRRIYEAILDLFERNQPIDLLTVSESLRKRSQLEEIGGSTYVATLLETIPTAANIRYHARMVREKAILRSLINVSTEVIAECYEHTEDVEELLDRAERMIFEISEQRINAAFANLKELLKDSIRYTATLRTPRAHHGPTVGIP